jgi:hypothetical protein
MARHRKAAPAIASADPSLRKRVGPWRRAIGVGPGWMAGTPVVAVGLNGSAWIAMPQVLPALACDRVWLRVLSRGYGKSMDPHWS